jgi:hypothetical protein
MAKRIIFAIAGVAILLLVIAILRPLPQPTKENCSTYTGTVTDVRAAGGPGDIVITLSGDEHTYYVNRGTENGLTVETLRKGLLNNTVELMVIQHWTPLDPGSQTKHIAQITHQGKVLYTEL